MEPALQELKSRLGEIADLSRALDVLYWDLEVWMPPTGGGARAQQISTLGAVVHERRIDDRLGELLDALAPYAASLSAESDDACLVRVARRHWEKSRRIPTELAAELAKTQAESYEAWVKAREDRDFAAFRPWLERILELRLRWIECYAPYDDPYDVVLDDFDEGMRTEQVREIFSALEPELTALVEAYATDDEDEVLRGPFPIEPQDTLSREVIERFGVSWDSFRLDRTVHPFEVTFGLGDVRLTTRYSEDDLYALFNAMHEAGHGLYEHGSSPTLDRTPLFGGESSSIHESQSRLWENVVGRSLPFWRWFYPRVQEAFPERLGAIPLDRFHQAVNRARRTFVRVDADETSYGLHVILRFELEQELIAGRLAVRDLPDAWNTRFEELLGLVVPNDRLGVLQDSHWAAGSFGYFPTYLIGSVLSVQIWEKARGALPDVEQQIERGDFSELHGWLRENLYVLGSKFTPAETIERVVGGPIDPEPYLRYLRAKLEALTTV
ncbi:MAG TPA: carboxypeptidase M32 [Gaiellaceae bacterium]|nr:carboxypeptidase M32 [Gaiellaceae bacterium]